RLSAIDFIEGRVQEFTMDCDFERVPWHLFTTEENTDEVRKEFDAATKANLAPTSETKEDFPFHISDIMTIHNQAQFNPLAYIRALARNIDSAKCQIFENTTVLKVSDGDPCVLETNRGLVKAKKVIMATHSPKGIYAVHTAMEAKREFAMAVRLRGPLPSRGVLW